MAQNHEKTDFVDYLASLLEVSNRGALADLRRGVTGPPGTVPATYPYVIPHLPKSIDPAGNQAIPYFLIASLFALYFSGKGKEVAGTEENIGRAFRSAKLKTSTARGTPSDEPDSTDQRFVALLNSDYDDLPNHLRYAISFLKSNEIPLDWHQLLKDLKNWGHPDRFVQKNWAKGFWGYSATKSNPDEEKQ